MGVKVVVIGGGPGGYVAALKAADLGGEVVLIEKENLGGTCLNWGCIPSKIMKNSAELLENCRKASKLGVAIEGNISADMPGLMAHKERILDTQRKGIDALLNSRGIRVEKGLGRIKAKGLVEILGEEPKEIPYDRLILAVGTRPLNVPDFPFDHEKILSSNDILSLDRVPESLTIVGGGVIGCEFAFIFSALGTKVTVVEAMSRPLPLPSVDQEISKLLAREMKKHKIQLLCDTIVTQADTAGDQVSISIAKSPFTDNPRAKDPKTDRLESELMAVCIGRTPSLQTWAWRPSALRPTRADGFRSTLPWKPVWKTSMPSGISWAPHGSCWPMSPPTKALWRRNPPWARPPAWPMTPSRAPSSPPLKSAPWG